MDIREERKREARTGSQYRVGEKRREIRMLGDRVMYNTTPSITAKY